MKTVAFRGEWFGRLVGSLLLASLVTGCATYRIDWNNRVGNYTYDQAIAELGPPDKSAKLTDGTTVAEWLTRRGYSGGSVAIAHGYGYPYYPYDGHYYHPWPYYYYSEPPSADYYIRLTFGPDGKLQSWRRVMR
jgi:hypothetical protein